MAWFDSTSHEPNWIWLLDISKEYIERRNSSCEMRCNGEIDFDRNKVLKKFLSEIDSRDLVTMVEPRCDTIDFSNMYVGGRHDSIEKLSLFCLEEDVGKIETNEPVHFTCSTEIGINDKEEFMKVIKLFIGK